MSMMSLESAGHCARSGGKSLQPVWGRGKQSTPVSKKNQRSAANPALQWDFLKTSQKRWLSKLILKESGSYPCHSRGLEEGKGTVYFPSAKATVKEKIVQLEKCNYFTMIEE